MKNFDERMKMKSRIEEEQFSDACRNLAGVVTGNSYWQKMRSHAQVEKHVLDEIGRFLNVKTDPSSGKDGSLE